MTLVEIAAKIDAHLKRFEADPEINKRRDGRTISPFYHSQAFHAGPYVSVRYVSFQIRYNLRKAEAEVYLAWLDAGNIGKHLAVKHEAA